MIEICKVELFKIRKQTSSFWVLVGIIAGICVCFVGQRFVQAREMTGSVFRTWDILPDAFYFFFQYHDVGVVRLLTDLGPILLAASVFSQDHATGMLRTLDSHGLHRARYLAGQGVAVLLSLILAWGVGALVMGIAGAICTYVLLGEFAWESRFWADGLHMVIGHTVRQFVSISFVLLTVVLFRQALVGAMGGLFYFTIVVPAESWLLEKIGGSPLLPYTLAHANKAVIDPSVPMPDLEFARAVFALLLSGLLIMAGAVAVFDRAENL